MIDFWKFVDSLWKLVSFYTGFKYLMIWVKLARDYAQSSFFKSASSLAMFDLQIIICQLEKNLILYTHLATKGVRHFETSFGNVSYFEMIKDKAFGELFYFFITNTGDKDLCFTYVFVTRVCYKNTGDKDRHKKKVRRKWVSNSKPCGHESDALSLHELCVQNFMSFPKLSYFTVRKLKLAPNNC